MKESAYKVEFSLVGSTSHTTTGRAGKTTERIRRLDVDGDLRQSILPFCRLKGGEVWEDPINGHRVGVLDGTKAGDLKTLLGNVRVSLVMADPPYNVVIGNANTAQLFKVPISDYMQFSKRWVGNAVHSMETDAFFYIWMGADYRDGFQPLPDFMILMRTFDKLQPKNYITVRNQRGYGTQRNWMWVRQELLCYQRGSPRFHVDAEYTDIPKILRGYYKQVNGYVTENLERSNSQFIRAGNVWVDIQQVFYRMEENVPGCYAQKPLKAVERIIAASSESGDLILDLFAHSGSGLIGGERLGRRVFTLDSDPIFAEITIRRLERFRALGKTGWQWESPFPELGNVAFNGSR